MESRKYRALQYRVKQLSPIKKKESTLGRCVENTKVDQSCEMSRIWRIRAFLGVKFSSRVLLRVKELTFRNSELDNIKWNKSYQSRRRNQHWAGHLWLLQTLHAPDIDTDTATKKHCWFYSDFSTIVNWVPLRHILLLGFPSTAYFCCLLVSKQLSK